LRFFSSYGNVNAVYQLTPGINSITIPTNTWPAGVSLAGLYVSGQLVWVEKVVKN
jgi:hypothetical protein